MDGRAGQGGRVSRENQGIGRGEGIGGVDVGDEVGTR